MDSNTYRDISPDIQEMADDRAPPHKNLLVRSTNPMLRPKAVNLPTVQNFQQTQSSKSSFFNDIFSKGFQSLRDSAFEPQSQEEYQYQQQRSLQTIVSTGSKSCLKSNRQYQKITNITSCKIDEAKGDWENSEEWKALKIEIRGKYIILQITQYDEKMGTCGWLLSETIRKVISQFEPDQLDFDPSDIIGLQTKEYNLLMNLYLSCLDMRLPVIEPGTILQAILRDRSLLFEKKVGLNHFEVIKKIGAGGFSIVYLVRRKDTGQYFAMKVIDKQLMVERDKEEIIVNERSILSRVKHKRIVRLHQALQTVNINFFELKDRKLIFVLDFCPGGELYYHLRKQKRFSEIQLKSLFIQIVQGIDYLHQNDIIYRDLKPENILIDQDGFIKIVDFGLSKLVRARDQLNFTFCGSLEYMAPEMITQSGHDFSLDYYTLGVLLYELVTGIPPFFAKSRQELIQNILRKDISFPKFISKELQHLISGLCQKDRHKRLGNKNGAKEIYQHPWLKDFKKITPIIKLSSFKLPFENIFLKQENLNIEEGPRCLGEELINKQTKTQQDEPKEAFQRFANFTYSGREDAW